jgi:hypothetical protein
MYNCTLFLKKNSLWNNYSWHISFSTYYTAHVIHSFTLTKKNEKKVPYLKLYLVCIYFKKDFVNELKNSIYQVKAGSPLAVFFMILILIVYAGVIEFKSSLIMHLNLPLKYNVPYLLILGFNFG